MNDMSDDKTAQAASALNLAFVKMQLGISDLADFLDRLEQSPEPKWEYAVNMTQTQARMLGRIDAVRTIRNHLKLPTSIPTYVRTMEETK